MSTFVRRALESDARFVVSSRVSTSRNAATVAGQPPTALADLDAFALVIVGAPDLMTPADADGLERFMHDRGGVVLLLMDAATENAAVDRLTGVTRWTRANRPEPSGVPLASEFQVPAELPRWAEPMAFARGGSPTSVVPVWQTPIGRGRLIVSGALDAWRYRDVAFDQFWKALAADATTEVSEEKPEQRSGVTEDTEALLRAWTSSHHGSSLAESDLAELAPALSRTLAAPVESTPLHPMRSAWWIIPFAGLLGFEWWDRRKNGRR